MKEAPNLANEIIGEWESDSPTKESLWIIKHGKRSLNKKQKM
jgi:3-methyladenine DNA glycosylase AlkC